jgi:hypothetical protein
MILAIPTAEEIDAYRHREKAPRAMSQSPATAHTVELPTKPCPNCQRTTFASAALCPGCFEQFPDFAARTVAVPQETAGLPAQAKTAPAMPETAPTRRSPIRRALPRAQDTENQSTILPVPGGDETTAGISSPQPVRTEGPETAPIKQGSSAESQSANKASDAQCIRQFNEVTRLMQSGSAANLAAGFTLQLEVRDVNSWSPVVCYEIYEDVSLRHEFRPTGQRKTIRIDLPPLAAVELAQNDLSTTWSTYANKYFRSKQQSSS